MSVVDPPAGIGLHAFRKIGSPRKGGNSVKEKITDNVRAEGQNAVAHEGRDLQIDIAEVLLQRQQTELRGLVLNLVQDVAVERRHAKHIEAKGRNLAGVVGNLEAPIEGASDQAHPRIGIDNAGHIRKAVELLRCVVECVVGRGRIFDATVIPQIIAGQEPIDRTLMPAVLEARLQPIKTSAIH